MQGWIMLLGCTYVHQNAHQHKGIIRIVSSESEDPEEHMCLEGISFMNAVVKARFSRLQFYHHLKDFYHLHVIGRRRKRLPKGIYISLKLLSSRVDRVPSSLIKIITCYSQLQRT